MMEKEVILGLVSAAVAVISAFLAIKGQITATQVASELESLRLAEIRRIDAEKNTAKYREPLAHAVYDPQSRLYNILTLDFLGEYYIRGDERSRAYVVENTTFLIAQYFAWTEIVRRDIQYIDAGGNEQTRTLARLRDGIYTLFQTDRYHRLLRVFAGEQRAIGERMIFEGPRGLECIGYAAFLFRVDTGLDSLTAALRDDVQNVGMDLKSAAPRLVALQSSLVDLLALLDPEYIRFPRNWRTKIHA